MPHRKRHATGGLPPGYKADALARLDRRTREGKLLHDVRRELIRHCGGSPSATQRQLIERAVQLTLRVALFDRAFLETGELSDHGSRHYLAFSGALTRCLAALGLKGAAEKQPTLSDYLYRDGDGRQHQGQFDRPRP